MRALSLFYAALLPASFFLSFSIINLFSFFFYYKSGKKEKS